MSTLTKQSNYRHTLISVQQRMKPVTRRFSRFIHLKGVESVSELLGLTILRPSITLGATTTSVIFTGFMYSYDRWYGFTLQGSELPLSLLVGAIAGLLIEIIYSLVRRLARLGR